MAAARDGDLCKVPETGIAGTAGEGIVAGLIAVFDQIMDRGIHFNTEVRRVKRELVHHGRLDVRLSASPGQSARTSPFNDVNQVLDAGRYRATGRSPSHAAPTTTFPSRWTPTGCSPSSARSWTPTARGTARRPTAKGRSNDR